MTTTASAGPADLHTDLGRAAELAVIRLGYLPLSDVQDTTLADTSHVARLAADAVRYQVEALRNVGASWATIGTALGISRQAAQQRYGRS